MPKRKSENTLDLIVKKLKYLEKEVKRNKQRSRHSRLSVSSSNDSSSASSSTSSSSPDRDKDDRALMEHGKGPRMLTDAVVEHPQAQSPPRAPSPLQATGQASATQHPRASPQPSTSREAATHLLQQQAPLEDGEIGQSETMVMNNQADSSLNPAILEILGMDPTKIVVYGPAINAELANRLTYITTSGLKKEERKDIADKYLVPENCQAIEAPQMNAEIKAALSEALLKRDKALESRQRCIATVISCLGKTITTQISSTTPNHELIQHLVDASRLLCDIQYNDSTSRKFFALSTLKKELKEQLTNTKIGKQLFGDSFGETLKTAKAVSKSGADLKEQIRKPNSSTTKNLNWKTTGPARRQAAGPSSSRRQPPPATATAPTTYQHHRQPPPPPPGNFSSASTHRPRHSRRR